MSIVKLRDLIEGESLLCGHRFEDTASRGLTDTALSCRPPVKVPSPGRRPPDESTPEPGGWPAGPAGRPSGGRSAPMPCYAARSPWRDTAGRRRGVSHWVARYGRVASGAVTRALSDLHRVHARSTGV